MVEIILICGFVALSLIGRFGVKTLCGGWLIRGAMLIMLLVWTFYTDKSLLSPIYWSTFVLSVVLSYLAYLLSLFIVGTKLNRDNLCPILVVQLNKNILNALIKESVRNIAYSTYEEFLYRWFFQNVLYELTNNSVVSICLGFLSFFLVHLDKRIAIVQMLDIFAFSIMITLWYHFTCNLWTCILIHIVRNELIICQKYNKLQLDMNRRDKLFKMLKERN